MPATATDVIEREISIAAPPRTVFGFLTDTPKLLMWMGRAVTADARPGGVFRVDYNGFDVMRGEFVEVSPFSRVVFTWGWESLAETIRPGQSRVEITLTARDGGTVLRLVHSGLPQMARPSHAQGWEQGLATLASVAAGGAPAPPAPLPPGDELGARLNTLLIELRDAVEQTPAARWGVIAAPEQRTVAALAHHMVDHLALADLAAGIAAGQRPPQADFTLDTLDAMNARTAQEEAATPRAEMLQFIAASGPRAVTIVRGLDEAALARSERMAVAGGAPMTVRQILEGPLLGALRGHLDSLGAAL